MVRKSVRNLKCKNISSVVVVEPGKKTPPKKYIKVRNFKDLQAEEVKLEENLDTAPAANMGRGSAENMETEKMSGQKKISYR